MVLFPGSHFWSLLTNTLHFLVKSAFHSRCSWGPDHRTWLFVSPWNQQLIESTSVLVLQSRAMLRGWPSSFISLACWERGQHLFVAGRGEAGRNAVKAQPAHLVSVFMSVGDCERRGTCIGRDYNKGAHLHSLFLGLKHRLKSSFIY